MEFPRRPDLPSLRHTSSSDWDRLGFRLRLVQPGIWVRLRSLFQGYDRDDTVSLRSVNTVLECLFIGSYQVV